MMKNYPNKAMKPKETGDANTVLICLAECEVPGMGAWKVGDKVDDPKQVEYLVKNPNFRIQEDS